jgi:hypothetical protein
MSYYYECPNCDRVTGLLEDDFKNPALLPGRTCFGCFEEGCDSCMPDSLCVPCEKEDAD